MRERKPIRWLQLSDLHIFCSTEWNHMLQSYRELSSVFKPDFIVVTGDFCHAVKNRSYKNALNFLNSLAEIFLLDKKNFFLVPGNHDADNFKMRKEIINTIRTEIDKDADVYLQYCDLQPKKGERTLHKSFEEYDKFVRDFYGDSIEDDRVKSPSDIYAVVWNDKINIVGLNTALISNGDSERKEIVDINKLSQIASQIDGSKPTIVLAHHDLKSLVPSQHLHLDRILKTMKVRAYLCGDEHRIGRDIANRYESGEQTPCIVCGKSAVEPRDDFSDVCVIGYTWQGCQTAVEVFSWTGKDGDHPFEFLKSNIWYHHVDKPYSFLMTEERDCPREHYLTEQIEEIWDDILALFQTEDQIIHEKLGSSEIRNKTNVPEEFQTTKIMTSLIKIGILFPAIAKIVRKAIDDLIVWAESNGKQKLTTQVVRRIVLSAIEKAEGSWQADDVKRWHTKYVRRYGHNNRIVEIYNVPSEINLKNSTVEMNYKFIKNQLLPDLFQSASASLGVQRISCAAKTNIADEVIEFINGCDLYRVDYGILKSMIREIAIQPPHPWLIDERQRNFLVDYDKSAVEKNLDDIEHYKQIGETVPSYVLTELIHHTSALLLDKYFYFCGCRDLDAFYVLRNYFRQMIKASFNCEAWDALHWDSISKNLYTDFRFHEVDVAEYYERLCEIERFIKNKVPLADGALAISKFARTTLYIADGAHDISNTLIDFTRGRWAANDSANNNAKINTILSLLFPFKSIRNRDKSNNTWWLRYYFCYSHELPEMKKSVLVVVLDETHSYDEVLNDLAHGTHIKETCNTIFFVKEQYSDKFKMAEEIRTTLRKLNLDSITPILLDKRDLNKILKYSGKRSACLDEIICNQKNI